MMKKSTIILLLCLFSLVPDIYAKAINTGAWRFELQNTQANVPFIIELSYNQNQLQGKLLNGKETIKLTEIELSKNKIIIPLQLYQASLELKRESASSLQGHLIKHNKTPKELVPVKGVHGIKERFPRVTQAANIDLTGSWSVMMNDEQGKKRPGVMVFEQEANKLYGSIITSTGDYRFFEGYASTNKFKVASFDGVFNYIIEGELKEDQELQATLRSSSLTKIKGRKDPDAALPDAYSQTSVEALQFSFPDIKSGDNLSLKDKRFQNKPLIIQVFGSWCPNCMDELNFLIPWYEELDQEKKIEVITLAFERSLNEKQAKAQLLKLYKKKKIPFTLLHAGSTAEDEPAKKLPGIKNFISFPTTIFLNRNHEVVKVHAGFSGPGTGKYFEQWKMEFDTIVKELLAK